MLSTKIIHLHATKDCPNVICQYYYCKHVFLFSLPKPSVVAHLLCLIEMKNAFIFVFFIPCCCLYEHSLHSTEVAAEMLRQNHCVLLARQIEPTWGLTGKRNIAMCLWVTTYILRPIVNKQYSSCKDYSLFRFYLMVVTLLFKCMG